MKRSPAIVCDRCDRRLPHGSASWRRYCSDACKSAASRERRRRAFVPTDTLGRAAWEAERRIAAGETIRWLEQLAGWIPTSPANAGELRRRVLELAKDLRWTFLLAVAPAPHGTLKEVDEQ
jgi:hypothetical protein